MTKISLELDEQLNKMLKQYALNRYNKTHGMQQGIIRDALIAYLNAQMSKSTVEGECVATTVECTVEDEPIPVDAQTVKEPKTAKKAAKKNEFKNDTVAIKKVTQLWKDGEKNIRAIVRQVPPYTYRTVSYWINKNLKGEDGTV